MGRRARARWTPPRRAFDALGSPGWAAHAREELAGVGGRAPRAAGELTPAERRVAELAAAGRSTKEIALTLVVSGRTVEAHLRRIYAKLGVRSRAQLALKIGGSGD